METPALGLGVVLVGLAVELGTLEPVEVGAASLGAPVMSLGECMVGEPVEPVTAVGDPVAVAGTSLGTVGGLVGLPVVTDVAVTVACSVCSSSLKEDRKASSV